MPSRRGPRSRSRQSTPQSPPKQSASTSSSRQVKRATRSDSRENPERPVRQKQPEQPLPAVEEEDQSSDANAVQPSSPADLNTAESAVDSLGSGDEIDDTSSNNTTQLEALDTDLIVDGLPGLYQEARQILSLFDSDDTIKLVEDISSPISRTSKRLRRRLEVLEVSRKVFGGGTYIDIPIILRKLTDGQDVVDGPWKPDTVLQLANLSVMIANLSQHDETTIYDTLERMFNTFPDPFGPFTMTVGRTTRRTESVDATVSFGIALRTQFFLRFIPKLRDSLEFDPDAVLQKTFFDDDGRINGFQVEGQDVLPAAKDAIFRHIENVRQYFRDSSTDPIDMTGLKRQYPWKEFLEDAIRWTLIRKGELENQIAAKGGLEVIQHHLEQGDFSSYRDQAPYTQATPDEIEHDEVGQEPEPEEVVDTVSKQPQKPRTTDKSVMAERTAQLLALQAESSQESESESESESEDGNEDRGNEEEEQAKNALLPTRDDAETSAQRSRSAISEIPQSPEFAISENDAGPTGEDDFADNNDNEVDESENPVKEPTPARPTQSNIIPTQQTLAVIQVAKEQEALSNKENINIARRLFSDKQANAKRLEWTDSQPGQKRARPASNDEEEESNEYETDTRPQKRARHPRAPPPNAADDWMEANVDDDVEETPDDSIEQQASQQLHNDAARSKAPPSTQPLPHRSIHQHQDLPLSSSRPPPSSAPNLQTRPPARTLPHQQQRHQSVSSINSVQQHDPIVNDYVTVNAEAKATMQERALYDPPVARRLGQGRRAWTVRETNRLSEMIATHGCMWARILTEDAQHPDGPELQLRTQVQLKDKARNMKMDYLKAGRALPEGFTGVTIKSSDKQLLREMGLPWEPGRTV